MPPGQYTGLIPIGQLSVSTPGTTVLLSANIGTQSGQVGGPSTWMNPPAPGYAWRYMEIQADAANAGSIYLMPRGATKAGNPGLILAKIPPGGSAPFPTAGLSSQGFVPENFCLDCDTAGANLAYGFATLG